jgi:uncharacterized protein YegP (UPF0339 family)
MRCEIYKTNNGEFKFRFTDHGHIIADSSKSYKTMEEAKQKLRETETNTKDASVIEVEE